MPDQKPPATSEPRYADTTASRAVADIAIARMKAGSVVRERRRQRVRVALRALAGATALIALVLFGARDTLHREPDSVVGADGVLEVMLEQNIDGHYFARGTINGAPVGFLLDTGATGVAVPEDIAHRLGLVRGPPVRTMTANGIGTGYRTRLASVSLGGIERRRVEATVSPGLVGESILLGMSFLRELTLEQRDGVLTIRDER